jgi:hypothetical protein
MRDDNAAAPPWSTSQPPDFLAWCAAASKMLLRQKLHQQRVAPATAFARSDAAHHAAPATPAASWREREATPSTSADSTTKQASAVEEGWGPSTSTADRRPCTADQETAAASTAGACPREDSPRTTPERAASHGVDCMQAAAAAAVGSGADLHRQLVGGKRKRCASPADCSVQGRLQFPVTAFEASRA